MASGCLLDVELRFLDGGGAWSTTTLANVDGAEVIHDGPVRASPSYVGSATTLGLLRPATTVIEAVEVPAVGG